MAQLHTFLFTIFLLHISFVNNHCQAFHYITQGVSGGIVNILGGGSMDYSE